MTRNCSSKTDCVEKQFHVLQTSMLLGVLFYNDYKHYGEILVNLY